jgi:pyruvate dehydrogenase E2 component (dihydrolipoamide acetyltransferase)
MARWEFKLPDLGEGVTEGEIVGWLVKVGDAVAEDQPMVEVMTDKATVTIAAPKAGAVIETHGQVGETIAVHAVLVVLELDADTLPRRANGADKHAARDESPAMDAGHFRDTLPGMAGASPRVPGLGAGYFNDKPLATPATRKLARDRNVDLRRVPPTGPASRVTRADVEAFERAPLPPASAAPAPIDARHPIAARVASDAVAAHVTAAPSASPAARVVAPRGAPATAREALEQRVPLAGLRRRIAQKMTQSTATAARFTFVEECDVGHLKELRARLIEPAAALGVKLSLLPFVVKAVVAALKKHPILNTTLDEATNEIVFRHYYHVGIATATEAGLMVPVVKDADRRSILDIAREIERLSAEARAGRSKLEDLQGSTFTVTSLGARGGLLATPIINYPEVAILGVHQIKSKPVVREGQIVVGDVMLLSLSFDHRIVDGHVGAEFAYEIIGYLEKPERLLLETV